MSNEPDTPCSAMLPSISLYHQSDNARRTGIYSRVAVSPLFPREIVSTEIPCPVRLFDVTAALFDATYRTVHLNDPDEGWTAPCDHRKVVFSCWRFTESIPQYKQESTFPHRSYVSTTLGLCDVVSAVVQIDEGVLGCYGERSTIRRPPEICIQYSVDGITA